MDDTVLSAELLYLRGQSSHGAAGAQKSLAEQALPPALKSRCLSVLAAVEFDQGDLEAALASGRQAMVFADQAGDASLAAVTSALLLERSCDRTGFDASLPMATQVRRRAMRCTDLQVRATIHLTFGRLEARVGHLHTALRHFTVGRQLIADDPNDLVGSSIDLDESSVLSLLGDVPGALDMAQRAAKSAAASGWAKGRRVAALNVAQFLVSLGRLSAVDAHVQRAREHAFQSVTYDVGLAETQAQVAYCRGLYDVAEDVLARAEQLSESVPEWYRLTNRVTRNRLLIRLERFREAVESITDCVLNAERASAEHLATTFRIQLAEALLGLGMPDEGRLLAASPASSVGSSSLSHWVATLGQFEGIAGRRPNRPRREAAWHCSQSFGARGGQAR